MIQKIVLSFFILAMSLHQVEAQEQRFKAGVILGVNLAQIDGDNSNGYIKPGISGGLRAAAIISDKIDLSFEILFDQRGSRSQKIFDENFFPFRITNNYISVPVLFNFQDWLDESEEYYKLHFHGGLSYGRLISTSINDEDLNSIFESIRDDFRRDDISAVVGATFYTGPHLAITGRFSRSLTPLYKNGDGPVMVRIPFISKHLTLRVLYMF